MLAAHVPNFAVVACSTWKVGWVFCVGIFCVAAADVSLSSSVMMCEEMCYCSGGKPDVTDYVVTAKGANLTCKEFDNPTV
jgi:hypothetical protein